MKVIFTLNCFVFTMLNVKSANKHMHANKYSLALASRKDSDQCAPSYKTFFMLNSAEHEIFSANKHENANNSWHFHIY